MLRQFLELFSMKSASGPATDPEQRVRLAACVLFLEMAEVNDEFTESEHQHVMETVTGRFGLAEPEAREMLEEARVLRRNSVDLWRFTNQLNETCSHAAKLEIIEEIWRIVYADGHIDGHEDHLVRRLGKLLNLRHRELIEAKLKVLDEIRGQGELDRLGPQP